MTRPPHARSGGFTLVELLVGLALIAVVAMLLGTVLSAGSGAAQRTERRAEDTESVAAAQALLRERIELLLADQSGIGEGLHGDAGGDARRFTFVAPALGNHADDGLTRYYVALDGGGVLDLAAIDARASTPATARWRVLPLIGNVQAIEWSYYGPAGSGDAPRWQSEWRGHDDPPQLVRLRLRFGPGDPRAWPDLLVRPATTVSTACDLDPTTGACRAS